MKKEYSFKDKNVVSMIRLTRTQTALVIDTEGSATMHFGRNMKGEDKLGWPELMLASIFVALGEKDTAALCAAMQYAATKLETFKKENSDAGRKLRVHRAGHVKRR